MPAIIDAINLANIGGGVVNFGDSLNIAPKSTSKTNQGSGSTLISAFAISNNGFSATNAIDPDVVDQPTAQTN